MLSRQLTLLGALGPGWPLDKGWAWSSCPHWALPKPWQLIKLKPSSRPTDKTHFDDLSTGCPRTCLIGVFRTGLFTKHSSNAGEKWAGGGVTPLHNSQTDGALCQGASKSTSFPPPCGRLTAHQVPRLCFTWAPNQTNCSWSKSWLSNISNPAALCTIEVVLKLLAKLAQVSQKHELLAKALSASLKVEIKLVGLLKEQEMREMAFIFITEM